MDLTDQYLDYLRQTKQYGKLDRHFAGYPEEKHEESFMDAMFGQVNDAEREEEPERDESWLDDGDNPFDFDSGTDNVPRISKPLEQHKGDPGVTDLGGLGYVRVFEYPNVPESKTVIRLCNRCSAYEFAYPDDFDVTDSMRQALNNATRGEATEIADNYFVISIEDWQNTFSKHWHVCWNYKEDFLCDDNGHISICTEAHRPDGADDLEYKFVVHKCSWKYCKQSGMDSALDRKYSILAYIYCANDDFLPDNTPSWLYDVMRKVQDASGGVFAEHEESTFVMDKKFYEELIKHPDCVMHSDLNDRNDEDDIDDWKDSYDPGSWDDKELYDSDIEQMDDDDEIWVYIWDGNLENGSMTDYSPSWLYEWLDTNLGEHAYSEEMESLFSMKVADYKRLLDLIG